MSPELFLSDVVISDEEEQDLYARLIADDLYGLMELVADWGHKHQYLKCRRLVRQEIQNVWQSGQLSLDKLVNVNPSARVVFKEDIIQILEDEAERIRHFE